jgi:catechol 2,3-dioxygenase-like lactoylglutathione lyase family enzyme
MRKKVFLLLAIIFGLSAYGQDFTLQYDHTALVVNDLKKSVYFYTSVLNLKEIETATANPAIRWFSLGNDQQLHLIEGQAPDLSTYKASHLALKISKLEALITKLDHLSIPYSDWPGKRSAVSDRGDGVHQIYFQDPDGYWIEVNDVTY